MFKARCLCGGVNDVRRKYLKGGSDCAVGAERNVIIMMNKTASPCLTCNRVRDPRSCENKNCVQWRSWFIQRWEQLRREARTQEERNPALPGTVKIGGIAYMHPDRVRSYLATDPCTKCLYPRELCNTPCQARRGWEEARSEVFL